MNVPPMASTLVLIQYDADESVPLWIIYDIPVTETGLLANISGLEHDGPAPPVGAFETDNLVEGEFGYLGSCREGQETLYRWELYALPGAIGFSVSGNWGIQADQIEDWVLFNSIGMASACHLHELVGP